MKNLKFLMMLFGLMIIITAGVSAQNTCSKKLDGKKIYVEIANMTNKAFTVNLVDEKCKEVPSDQQVPSMEIFSRILTNGQAFRVREDGTNKILHQFVVNPEKPIIFIETDLDGSKLRVRDFDVISDDDFKKRADAAFASVKSEPENTRVGKTCSKKLGGKPVNIKWLNKTNESLLIRRVGENCEEDEGEYLWRDKTFETTSYPGEVFHIYIAIESDEGGTKDYKMITVNDSNGAMTLKK